jgi:hypothetical protein
MVVAELLTRLGFEVDPRELNRGLNQARSSLQGFKSFLGKLALGVGFYEIGKHVVNMAAELETLNTQLHVMTGSTEKTQFLFKGIVDYAKNTAFYVKDVTGSVSTLLQGMVNVTDIMPKVKQLGDVAKDSTQLSSLAYAYAQVNRQGYMTNYESRMFQRSGQFGVYNQYAQMEAVQQGRMTKGQEITKGSALDQSLRARQGELFAMARHHEFTVQMLDKALDYATTKGGIFFEHQKEQVKTFAGAWSNMWDVLNINAALAMQKLFPIFKGLMKAITDIPMDWLSDGFESLANGLRYIWAVLVTDGLLTAWQVFKDAWKDLMGALPGGRGELGLLANTLSIVARTTIFLLVGVVRLVTYMIELYKWMKAHKEVLVALAAVLGSIFLPKLLLSSTAVYELRFAFLYLQEALALFMRGGFVGVLGWFSKLGPLALSASRSIGIFMNLWGADKLFALEMGVRSLGDGIVAMFTRIQVATPIWVAALSILAWQIYRLNQLGLETMKQSSINAAAYAQKEVSELDGKIKKKRAEIDALPASESFRRTLLADELAGLNRDRADAMSRKSKLLGAAGSQETPDDYLAKLNADANRIATESDAKLAKILEAAQATAKNTAPKGGVPNDVLRLADMSFRTHFDIAADGLMLAAE